MSFIDLKGMDPLTSVDWSVVAIARSDGPLTVNPEGYFARFLRSFFGLSLAHGLSNPRAETLRRFCVRAWYWDFIRTRDLRALIDAGYSMADVDRILAHVATFRGFTPSLQEAAA